MRPTLGLEMSVVSTGVELRRNWLDLDLGVRDAAVSVQTLHALQPPAACGVRNV